MATIQPVTEAKTTTGGGAGVEADSIDNVDNQEVIGVSVQEWATASAVNKETHFAVFQIDDLAEYSSGTKNVYNVAESDVNLRREGKKITAYKKTANRTVVTRWWQLS